MIKHGTVISSILALLLVVMAGNANAQITVFGDLEVKSKGGKAATQSSEKSTATGGFHQLRPPLSCAYANAKASSVNKNGEWVMMVTSIDGLKCQIQKHSKGNQKADEDAAPQGSPLKAIELASTTVSNGVLKTKQFGTWKLAYSAKLDDFVLSLTDESETKLKAYLAQK